ncbi:MAG: aminotransferase class I/II-fold pyridoxal phosphate-dependent enzyme, partial [Tabrizicola sp.]
MDFVTRDPLGLRDLPLSDIDRPTAGTDPVDALQTLLAAELGLAAALVFPSTADAIRHALPAFLRPCDEVLVDCCADPALSETVSLTGARLHRYPSASLDGVERRLHRLTRNPGAGRLVIVAPAVSARCARVADVAGLAELARRHGASLVVDVAQDFGLMGQAGRGVMEIQSCLGRVDLVLGCLAGAFGTTGGFVAWGDAGHHAGLRRDRPASASLHADRARIALAAAALVFGTEGRRRRRRLHGLSLRLRNQLTAAGLRVPGEAVPFVPVLLPLQTALPRTALL